MVLNNWKVPGGSGRSAFGLDLGVFSWPTVLVTRAQKRNNQISGLNLPLFELMSYVYDRLINTIHRINTCYPLCTTHFFSATAAGPLSDTVQTMIAHLWDVVQVTQKEKWPNDGPNRLIFQSKGARNW